MENKGKNYQIITTLITHLHGGKAYIQLEEILKDITCEQAGIKFPELPYTFFQLFDHMRIAQKDLLEYCTNPDYVELKWPDDYWPENSTPTDPEEWEFVKTDFFDDRQAFNQLLSKSPDSLFEPLANGPSHHLFREGLLNLEHNAYHTGQLMIMKRLLENLSTR